MTEEGSKGIPTHRAVWKDKEHGALCCCQKSPPFNWPVKVLAPKRARNSIKRRQEGTWQCCALYSLPRRKRYRKNYIRSALGIGTTYKHQITAKHPEKAMPRENQDTSTPFSTLQVWSASLNSGQGESVQDTAKHPRKN